MAGIFVESLICNISFGLYLLLTNRIKASEAKIYRQCKRIKRTNIDLHTLNGQWIIQIFGWTFLPFCLRWKLWTELLMSLGISENSYWISSVKDFNTRAKITFICYVPIKFSDVGLKVCVIIILVLQTCTSPRLLLLPSDIQRRQNFSCVLIECVGIYEGTAQFTVNLGLR